MNIFINPRSYKGAPVLQDKALRLRDCASSTVRKQTALPLSLETRMNVVPASPLRGFRLR